LLLRATRTADVDPRAAARAEREGCRLLLATGERDLDRAIRWATRELGERYVLHGR
jgi:hypothetical protein